MFIEVLKYSLIAIFTLTLVCAAVNSIRSHRSTHPAATGVYRSWTNIWMGAMLIVLALILMFVFSGSTLSIVVEALFLLVGAYNLFAGFRNRSHYARLQQQAEGRSPHPSSPSV
ncbi:MULTISPECIES: YtpI family protein [Paenibacillus]|uniref:YtpI family protein n=1 Tax=Paenibacillus TaxID=44249 RepID=UPI0011AA1F0C|nr:YtpI family protein [Paenibacillus xylanexedens]